jgi:hypothetical protein
MIQRLNKLAAYKQRKWVRALIVLSSPVWAVGGVVLALTFYILMALVWMIGCPIAKAIRYIRFGDTETEFFDELEDALNFL